MAAALLLTACSRDSIGTSKYSSLPARFTCNTVTAMPSTLYTAINNPGLWCTVRVDNTGNRYKFDLAGGKVTEYWNLTANKNDKAHVWVAGLIVGMPSIPEPGALASIVTCYDLVCPSCYKIPLDRPLAISSSGIASCTSCGNTYDMNNQGIHVKGESVDTHLFRYRVSYLINSNTLIVSN